MAQIQFLRGIEANLASATVYDGSWYLTTDTHKLYVGQGTELVKVGDCIVIVDNYDSLPTTGNTDQFYFVSNDNKLYRYFNNDYVLVNVDTGATSVVISGEGNVITGASYNAKTRTITLTKTTLDLDSVKPDIYEITSESTDITVLSDGIIPKQGDLLVVTNALGIKTVYQYDEDWIACSGNVDASKVLMTSDLTITANVGVQTVGSTGSKTLETTGKSVKQVMDMLFASEKNPTVTQPSVTLTAGNNKAYEVGTTVTPVWSASLNAGSYSYGPATGITPSSWEISNNVTNETASTASGSFNAVEVGDSTSYKITAKANYDQGAIPVSNLGNNVESLRIAAGSKSANSSTLSGYREWFTYVGNDLTTLDSAVIRSTTKKGNNSNYNVSLTIPAGTNRVFVAIPASKNKTLSSVIDVDGMGLDVKGNFTKTTVSVEGANGYTAIDYHVFITENLAGLAATTYKFTF